MAATVRVMLHEQKNLATVELYSSTFTTIFSAIFLQTIDLQLECT